jgi:hypothetical protein
VINKALYKNDPVEIPSLEEVEKMERQRSQAIEALEISDNMVKCQRCRNAIPIVGKTSRPANDRVAILQARIKWIEIIIYLSFASINCVSNFY